MNSEIKFVPIWFDSMGAKSSAIFVETPEVKIIIDPGAAVMQPGYPLSEVEKEELRLKALKEISNYGEKADLIFISHYHYDHHILPSKIPPTLPNFYRNKKIFTKNPNVFINLSQWKRARKFLLEIYGKKMFQDPEKIDIKDELSTAKGKDKKWLKNLISLWEKEKWVMETENVKFCDSKAFKFGKTTLRFTEPLYHGSKFERIGWVVALVIERGDKKLIYSSDIQGPILDKYADWIIAENPEILILDGPPTYLMGYRVKVEEIKKGFANLKRILQETDVKMLIYDHHLLREKGYRKKGEEIYRVYGNKIITAAEFKGKPPLIDTL